MKRLTKLETEEVSLVPRGANKRKFLILKSGESMSREELLKKIQNCDPEVMKRVEKIVKDYNEGCAPGEANKADEDGLTPLDERAAAAMKATARILTPFKGKIPAPLVHKMVEETLGSDEGEDMATKEAGASMSPEPIKEEHKVQAMKAAKAAYGAEMKKLGYPKYNDSDEIAQKDVEGIHGVVTDDEAEEEEQEGTMHDPDVEKGSVMKSLEASVSKLPKEQRKVLTPILKSLQLSVSENETLKKEVSALRHRELKREFVQKAASFKAVGSNQDELADTLMDIANKAPESYAKIEKILQAADEAATKGNLFGEIGSSLPGTGAHENIKGSESEWSKIQKAAVAVVQKSGDKVSVEEAVDRFLDTSEGKKMYRDYIAVQMKQRS